MNRIAMLRKEKGLSQISLSLKLNVSQKMISAYGTEKVNRALQLLCKWQIFLIHRLITLSAIQTFVSR